MPHVEKRGPKRWRARYRGPDGRERSKTFERKVDAERFLVGMEHSKSRGTWVDPKDARVTFGAWVEQYDEIRRRHRATTEARNGSLLRVHVLPRFKAVPLARIDNLMIREWVADLVRAAEDGGAGLAPGSVAKVFQVLDAALQAAVDAKMIPSNPADRVPLPADECDEKRFLLPEEVLHLADVIQERYRVLVLLAASTGLRIGELAGLRRNRIDLLRGRLEVVEIVTEVQGYVRFGPPKTKAGRRTVPIPRSVVEEVLTHLAKCAGEGPDGLVFAGQDGGVLRPPAWRQRVWHPAVERAGLAPLTPHELRHTAVAWWISAGVDPKRIAVWAGHRSVKTILDTYGHLLPSDDDALTERVDALLTSAPRRSDGQVVVLRR